MATVDEPEPYPRTKAIALSAIFAALLSVSSVVSIPLPITPVPVTLQVFVVLLLAAVLGPAYGALSCVIYLLLGALGLPVYAGAGSGVPVLLGPLGGYLFGFPAAVLLGGLLSARRAEAAKRDLLRVCAAGFVALSVIYLLGVVWLSAFLHVGLYRGFVLGALPFIPVDAAKAAISVPVAVRIRWSGLDLPVVGRRDARGPPA